LDAIDTNVIIRVLARDDEAQFAKAMRVMSGRVFVPESVILESEWVLRDVYDFAPPDVCRLFRTLFGLKNVTLADPDKIARILDWHEAGMDFADAFHLANSLHLKDFKTFDRDFAKRSKNLPSPPSCKVSPI
jgi:predicted nucleic-acid-binding protein